MWTLCAVGSRGSPTKSDPFSCITVTVSATIVQDMVHPEEGINQGS